MQAKLPVMALLGVSLLAERLLLEHLHGWMQLGANNEVGRSWSGQWVGGGHGWVQLPGMRGHWKLADAGCA